MICTPKMKPIARNQIAVNRPSAAVPASRPRTIAKRGIGAASRRSVKPISMSTASAIPPLLPASSVDWTIAPASMKARKLSTGGKPGRSTARPAPPLWIASSRVGKTISGAISCGRRKVCWTERVPSAATTRQVWRLRIDMRGRPRARTHSATSSSSAASSPGSSAASSAPSRCWPVFSTKTSSRVGSTSSSDSTRMPRSSSARTTGAISVAPPSSSTISFPPWPAAGGRSARAPRCRSRASPRRG